MISFRKFISVTAVAVLGVTNLLTPLSYANAANLGDYDDIDNPITAKSFSFIMPSHDVYLKAFTEANKYFVRYEGNTHTSGEMGTGTFTYDTTGHLAPNEYVKTGYTWEKWNTQADGSGTDYASGDDVWNWTTVESGVVPIYAQWSANGYNISYNLNDATGTSEAVHSKTPSHLNYDQSGTILNPSRTGYKFSGWNITGMDTESHIVGGEVTSATTADEVYGTSFKNLRATSGTVNFLAQWTADNDTEYKVEHYLEELPGGYGDPIQTDHLSGTTDTEVKPSTHTYTGFTADDAPASGNIKADGSTVFKYHYTRNSYDLTLVAGRGIASVSGSGTQNTSGGSADADESVTISFKYDEPVNVHYELKSGYTGASWSGYQGGSSTFNMLASSGTKTASATPITYEITYYNRGGTTSGTNPATYNVESTGFTLINPTRDHSKFEGWTGSNGSSEQTTVTIAQGSTGDRVYYANWSCVTGYHIEGTGTESEVCAADTDTKYLVNHIQQDLEGEYTIYIETGYRYGTTNTNTAVTGRDDAGFELVGTIDSYNENIEPDGSTVINIHYKRLSYNVTVDDPTGVDSDSITVTTSGDNSHNPYLYGDTVAVSATLETGYTFNGWTAEDGSGNDVTSLLANPNSLNTSFTMPANSVKLTPNVTRVTYSIEYELYSGHEQSPNPTSYTVESGAITLNKPARDHSVFLGWTGTDLSGTTQPVIIPSGSVGNRKYYAVWGCATGYHASGANECVANTYHVDVPNLNGTGHSAPDNIVFTYDATGTLPEAPSQSGYDFVGWIVTGMSGGVEHKIGEIVVTGDDTYVYSGTSIEFKNLTVEDGGTVTLTAIWTPRDDTEYVIYHYYKELGEDTYFLSGTDELTGTTDTEVVFLEKLKNKTGFTYSGGYLNGGTTRPTTGKVTTGNIEKDGSTKIYLYYDRNKLTVYLSGDDHVATLSGAGTYEYGATVNVDMTAKTGYHFKEWRKKTDGTFETDGNGN